MAAPSFNDYYTIGLAEAQGRQPNLAFLPGDITDFYLAAIAAMADHLTAFAAQRLRATFLDGARGDDLTVLADDHWNIQRITATRATGILTFTRGAPGPAGTIPAGTTAATAKDLQGNEVQIVTTSDVNWALNETGAKVAQAVPAIAGKTGNVAANSVTRILSQLFDTFTLTNPAFAGGADAESDAALRDRVRNYPATIRRATLSALEYGAIQTANAGVGKATAVEDQSSGIVTVYVTDVNGNSSPSMVSAVQTEINNWRAAGTIVNVVGASLYELTPINVTLSVRTGVNTAAIAPQVQAAIVARLARLRIGETCFTSQIRQAAMNVDPDGILECTVTAPLASSVVPLANQVIRTFTGDITVS